MLSYHPINDPYHCIFRFLLIYRHFNIKEIEIVRLKYLDFFYLFPKKISKIRFTNKYTSIKTQVKKLPKPYEHTNNIYLLYSEISKMHDTALNFLIGKSIIDIENIKNGKIVFNVNNIPSELIAYVDEYNSNLPQWFDKFYEFILNLELKGVNGLLARCKLGEYKYDNE